MGSIYLFEKLLVVSVLVFSYFECGPSNVSQANTPVGNSIAATPQSTPAAIPKDLLITLERGPCMGRCPQYKVTISADATVEFEGKSDTKVTGKASGKITLSELKQLVAEFEKMNYFDLKERYTDDACPQVATDMSGATVSYQLNGKQKTVFHYHGCMTKDFQSYPPGLNLLENKIDDIAKTDQWVGRQ